MKAQNLFLLWICLFFFLVGSPLVGSAQEPDRSEKIAELEKKIGILAEEIEKLKLGAVAEPKYESYQGLGPAASKVYKEDKGVSIGGYGEVIYENYQSSEKKDFGDAQRFILYSGYKFNDWIVMNTELEFEHGGISNVGAKSPEVYIEFSYIDFLLKKDLNFRTGLMLMPIGITNEYHEPTVFHGVKRPDIESNVIPSTWRDLGVMVYGTSSKLSYNAAIVNGLRADRFSKGSWIRKGRQNGAGINAGDFGGIVRLNYELTPDLTVGGAIYKSQASHGKGKDENPLPKTAEMEGKVNLWELHAQYRAKSLQLKGLYTHGRLDANTPLQGAGVGRTVAGWYAEAAYELFLREKSGSRMTLTPFFRYEKYDTHKSVFKGMRDPMQARTVKTFGVDFKPHSNVVLKADFQWRDTESNLPSGKGAGNDENKIDQFNLGLGFIF